MASSAPVLLQVVGTDGTTTTVPTYPQNVYTNPALALQAAKQVAQNQKVNLGTPKPASVVKKHKVSFLAGLSESITKFAVKEVKAIPKGFNSLIKDLGAGGGSNSTSSNEHHHHQHASTATSTTPASTTGTATSTVRHVRRDRRFRRHAD